MEVKLEEYVYGGCTIEERDAVRGYIMEDFYNAFDVIEMMRDRAYEELAPRTVVSGSVCDDYTMFDECDFDFAVKAETIPMPSVSCSRSCQMEPPQPRSLLAMLNNYLAKE